MVDTHGLPLEKWWSSHIRMVVGSEDEEWEYYDNAYEEIYYNMATGEVWTHHYYHDESLEFPTVYDASDVYINPDIIRVCITQKCMTEQDIADLIYQAVQQVKK